MTVYFNAGEKVEINRANWAGIPDGGIRFDHWTEGEIVNEGTMEMDAFGGMVQQHIKVAVPGVGVITRNYQPGKADEFIRKIVSE